MANDRDPQSNEYFFITGFADTLGLGKNSFAINPTSLINEDKGFTVAAFGSDGKSLFVQAVKPKNAKFGQDTSTGYTYYVKVESSTKVGIGYIEVSGTTKTSEKITWKRNVKIDPNQINRSEVRLFDSPHIDVTPKMIKSSVYSNDDSPYKCSTGTFYSKAVTPINGADADFDKMGTSVIYQIVVTGGDKFTSQMNGEKIRLSNIQIKRFVYSDNGNHEIIYSGPISTDFIATIVRVVSDTSLLIDLPFSTVSEILNRSNRNSEYERNDLVNIRGYESHSEIEKQNVYHKKNFYCLSIESGTYEVIHLVTPEETAMDSNVSKTILTVELSRLRALSGRIGSYKVYGRSLNWPESKRLLSEGIFDEIQLLKTNDYNNSIRGDVGKFYTQAHTDKYWIKSGQTTFIQSHSTIIDGAKISHVDNSSELDYVIFKDHTSYVRDQYYYNPNLMDGSYWYARSDAFLNRSVYPLSTYKLPSVLGPYIDSQENLTTGTKYDSNPVRLQGNSLYKFSMRVRSSGTNSDSSLLKVYFITDGNKTLIGSIDSTYNYGANEVYSNTFFIPNTQYGTILLVPIKGEWDIGDLMISPYIDRGYGPDSYQFNIPIENRIKNEAFEIEVNLYDSKGDLAYGTNSYLFHLDSTYLPLRKVVFIDPDGVST